MYPAPLDPQISIGRLDSGRWLVNLERNAQSLSRCLIVPLEIHVGVAVLRMDGIGDVFSEPDCRNQGLSRRVLEEAVRLMRGGNAAVSMLYGIPNYYHKFGYQSAGANHCVVVNAAPPAELPAGYTSRCVVLDDLPAIRSLYDRQAPRGCGARRRWPDCPTWQLLMDTAQGLRPGDACRVVCDPDGHVRGYAWRGKGFWPLDPLEAQWPGLFGIGEAIAGDAEGAAALITACGHWAWEERSADQTTPPGKAALSVPPDSVVGRQARRMNSLVCSQWAACGDSMVCLLDAGRLIRSLLPELQERARQTRWTQPVAVSLRTPQGSVSLRADAHGVQVEPDEEAADLTVEFPVSTLATLAMGAFEPADLLDSLPEPPQGPVRELLEALFPLRYQHLYFPDRY